MAAYELAASEGGASSPTATSTRRYLEDPRHVSATRRRARHRRPPRRADCSIQRRHQARRGIARADGHAQLRERICAIAVKIRAPLPRRRHRRGRSSARTTFLEMNTRLQAEHPVTEMVTGIGIVREQWRRRRAGHLLAEDASSSAATRSVPHQRRIRPSRLRALPGTITRYEEPGARVRRLGRLLRLDGAAVLDSLLAKLIAWDETREAATARMLGPRGVPHRGPRDARPFHRRSERHGPRRDAANLLGDPIGLADGPGVV